MVALANEGGGYLVFGVKEKSPNEIVGTAFSEGKIGKLTDDIYKDMDVLLVREKGSNELKVANKDGKVKAVKPEDGDNPDLFKINMRGNLIENFFENFNRQVKDPTRFEFFRVPAEKFQEVVNKLQEAFQNPTNRKTKSFWTCSA